jgi:hypothetical protein
MRLFEIECCKRPESMVRIPVKVAAGLLCLSAVAAFQPAPLMPAVAHRANNLRSGAAAVSMRDVSMDRRRYPTCVCWRMPYAILLRGIPVTRIDAD